MFDSPSYLVQVGFQGKNRVTQGLNQQYVDGAILSPSDYIPNSNEGLAQEINSHGKTVLFDPQFYLPDQGDREKQNHYDYHDNYGGEDYSSTLIYDESVREEFFSDLNQLQDGELNCDAYISPAGYLSSLSTAEVDDWAQLSEEYVSYTKSMGEDKPIFITMALSAKHLADSEMRSYLLNKASLMDADGFYVSVMYDDRESRLPLRGKDNVKTYLEIMLSLKVNGFEVIAGHTHHIAHLLFTVGVDAFASGHFKNLRSFEVDRWVSPDDPDPKQRVPRYYSDEVLETMRPDHLLTELSNTGFDLSKIRTPSPYEDDLFSSSGTVNPGWPESEGSWDHHIWCCNSIADQYKGRNLDERISYAKKKIRKGKALSKKIQNHIDDHTEELDDGFYDDWEEALNEVTSTHEFERLKRKWS